MKEEKIRVLIKTVVEFAVEQGYTATAINSMVRDAWRECMEAKIGDVPALEKETSEEQEFRKKASHFFREQTNVKNSHWGRLSEEIEYEEDGEKKYTLSVIEVACAMHKAFAERKCLDRSKIQKIVQERLKAMVPIEYPAYAEANRATSAVIHVAESIIEADSEAIKAFSKLTGYEYKKGTMSHYILAIEWKLNR